MKTTTHTQQDAKYIPCGYCTHCGYGGQAHGGSESCLHKQPARNLTRPSFLTSPVCDLRSDR